MQKQLLVLVLCSVSWSSGAQPAAPAWTDLSLEETEGKLVGKLGVPAHVSAGAGYKTLDYMLGTEERDDEDFDLTFYFEEPSGRLISATRNFARPAKLTNLLTADVHYHVYQDGRGAVLNAASRTLSGDRVLIAIGVKNGETPCSQAILMRRSVLDRFYPWIAKDLK